MDKLSNGKIDIIQKFLVTEREDIHLIGLIANYLIKIVSSMHAYLCCKKDEPNLTTKVLADWIKLEYKHDFSSETAMQVANSYIRLFVTLYLQACFLVCVHITVVMQDSIGYSMTFFVTMHGYASILHSVYQTLIILNAMLHITMSQGYVP